MVAKDIYEFRFKTMEEKLDKIDEKLSSFIEKADDKFATKDQHNANSVRIEKIENLLSKINWVIISAVILAVLTLIMKVWIK